ncbi:outer membrane protein assembly factor BamE [Zoogloea sp.]|uniref:outer membrane protein assembly factor BamE n=1 Tax=Zoogloea sp. TaxID=49181 RepID=UPI001ACAF637|nr:outer membrane protein assembly factor BamE [Zoogloea sp.]MBN8281653.1 outer membrane protein assembly factor BamE [Zoogloea sp.]
MRTLLTSALLVATLAGCSSVSDFLSPYRIDVRQGNFVSQEMVAQLKPGMSREQVRFVLGAPLLTDVFHADRWDYVYRFQPGKGKLQERKLTVIFENGSLARLEGDVRPDEAGTQ